MDDVSGQIVGTDFDPRSTKKGNEELERWLLRLLEPKLDFRFHDVVLESGLRVVLLEIDAATRHPVRFDGQEWLRVGSYKKKLKDFPEKERALWRVLDQVSFEDGIALGHAPGEDVLRLLDYPSYFELLELPLPEARSGILAALEADALIRRSTAGSWDITKLGAVLFARRLQDFDLLARKAMRVIQYRGNSRVDAIREHVGTKGYASGFKGLMESIQGFLPSNEHIERALRRTVPIYPELAIREIVANALIHQDFLIHGAGPMVELFENRMEVTNPGTPLVETSRFLDTPPRSRNERLASLMRRLRICEERGSGVDKIVFQTELHQPPAPSFETTGDTTRVMLLAPRPLSKMDREDRIRACYLPEIRRA
jgi:predicted HTH transcriptional regulator